MMMMPNCVISETLQKLHPLCMDDNGIYCDTMQNVVAQESEDLWNDDDDDDPVETGRLTLTDVLGMVHIILT